MNKQTIFGVTAVVLVVVFVVAASMYREQAAERVETAAQEQKLELAPAHSMSFGPEDARVTIVEFFDPACETCAQFHKPVKQLLEARPDQVRLVLRYLPLHHGSEDVAKMLEAARKQNRFPEVLEVMFKTQRRWASHHAPQPEALWEIIPAAGVDIDMEQLRADVGELDVASVVQNDIEAAAALGIRKTPGFLVNGKPLPSFGLRQLQQLVDAEIAAVY